MMAIDRVAEFKELRVALIEFGYEEKEATELALRTIFAVYTPSCY